MSQVDVAAIAPAAGDLSTDIEEGRHDAVPTIQLPHRLRSSSILSTFSNDNIYNVMEQKKSRGRPPGPLVVEDAAEKGKQYKRFFDAFVSETTFKATEEPFEASAIGASYWSSAEKAAIFRALDITQDPAVIAASITTKSSLEVREYIVALQEASFERQSEGLADYDAARDITEECQVALDAKADALERTLLEKLAKEEQTKYGEEWLLDNVKAELLDEQYTKQESADHTTDSLSIASAELVSPTALLEVSRNVFMNHGTDKVLRYTKLPVRLSGAEGPALFRSAFEALHEICVDYTKRLVTAAHFQALSRLRAHTDDRLKPVVRGVDVRTALDIMGIDQPDAHGYWAKKVKEYRVKLYSESRELNDGRRHIRGQGYMLTLLESMQALEQGDAETLLDDDAAIEWRESSSDHDSLSAVESAHEIGIHDLQPESDSDETEAGSAETESDFDETPLQKYDDKASRDEENILRRLLRLPQLPDISDEETELQNGSNNQSEGNEEAGEPHSGSADPEVLSYHDQASETSEVASASTRSRKSFENEPDVGSILKEAHQLVQPVSGLKSKQSAEEIRKRKREFSSSKHSKRYRYSSSE